MIPNAIPQPLLARVQAAFHAAAASAIPGTLEFASDLHKTPAAVIDADGVIEITQPYEHHPDLQELLELPRPMAVLEGLLGERVRSLRHVHGERVAHRTAPSGRPDAEQGGGSADLFYSTNGHVLPTGVDCDLRWHADGDFLRYTWLIEDLPADGGGTPFMPGTHRVPLPADDPKPGAQVPAWVNNQQGGETSKDWRPRSLPGAIPIHGKAGSCVVNFTSIWHSRGFNEAASPRCLIWQVIGGFSPDLYKRLRGGLPLLTATHDPETGGLQAAL